MKAIFAADPSVPRAFDPVGLAQTFTFWSVVPPQSVFAGIEELPPATVRTYGADGAELLGQAIKAFVVPERSVDLTARAVQLHCQARLESFMVPKYIEIVAALPRTDTGKISKIGLG